MEVLEERSDVLIISGNDCSVQVLEKNPYTLLKYKYYHGKKIRYVHGAENDLSIEETDQDGVFLCTFCGITVTIPDSREKTANAIFEAQSTGSVIPLLTLWKLKYVEKFLDISIVLEANSPVELTREGKLSLPKFVDLAVLEWLERFDGGRVVKVELSRKAKSSVDRIFTHEIQTKQGQPVVVVNETAVVLIGRDETEQCWMHAVPPEYRNRSVDSCEMWLSGGEDEKDELIDVLAHDK